MNSKQKTTGRVVFVSGINGWSIAGVGLLGALFSLLTGEWFGFLLCLAIAASGWMELKGRSKLKQQLPEAAGWLTASQLWLLVIIVLYAGFQLASFDAAAPLAQCSPEIKSLLDSQLGPEDSQAIGMLVAKLYYTTYISLIAAAFLYQGGLWLYYRSSAKKIFS